MDVLHVAVGSDSLDLSPRGELALLAGGDQDDRLWHLALPEDQRSTNPREQYTTVLGHFLPDHPLLQHSYDDLVGDRRRVMHGLPRPIEVRPLADDGPMLGQDRRFI